MTRDEFERVVEAAIGLLPREIRAALDNLVVMVEDRPSFGDVKEAGLGGGDALFGLFRGVPLNQRSFFDGGGYLPNQIILFRHELEDACRDREELTEEITLTLIHEVGHYLGLGEEEIRGLEEEARKGLRGR